MHVNGNCTTTTIKGKQVNVNNSSFVTWDQESYKALQFSILQQMQQVSGAQQQTGAYDCGLFAIAYATTLAFKGDSSQARYNQMLHNACTPS